MAGVAAAAAAEAAKEARGALDGAGVSPKPLTISSFLTINSAILCSIVLVGGGGGGGEELPFFSFSLPLALLLLGGSFGFTAPLPLPRILATALHILSSI
jgi:hypothetical protein